MCQQTFTERQKKVSALKGMIETKLSLHIPLMNQNNQQVRYFSSNSNRMIVKMWSHLDPLYLKLKTSSSEASMSIQEINML